MDTPHEVYLKSLSLQREEMAKHKWYLSEKAMHDLGTEAVFDWVEKYGEEFRKKFNQDVEEVIKIIKHVHFLDTNDIDTPDEIISKALIQWIKDYDGPKYT